MKFFATQALICSCEAVSKGAICTAVTEGGVTTLDGMKKCTKAGTCCGGCVPLVKDLITDTLKANGAYIKNNRRATDRRVRRAPGRSAGHLGRAD